MKTLVQKIGLFAIALFNLGVALGYDEKQDEAFRMQLNRFLLGFEERQSEEFKKLNKKVEALSSLGVSPCLLDDWLTQIKGQLERGVGTFDDLFMDKIDQHLRVVDSTEKEIRNFIARKGGVLNNLEERQVHDLSLLLAANELSERTIKNQVLPRVFNRIDGLSKNIETTKNLVADLREAYRTDFESLCARINRLEQKVEQLSKVKDSTSRERPSILYKDAYPAGGNPSVQRWQPDQYVTSISHLCPNAKLVAVGYTFFARVHRSNEVVLEEKYGDVYANCQGKVVLLLRNNRQ